MPFKVAAQAAMSLVIVAAVTAILLYVKAKPNYSEHLVYIYLLPVVLIAILFTARIAILSAAAAIACSAYFLQEPIHSFYVTSLLERGDLIWFAILSVLAVKCIRILIRPTTIGRLDRQGWLNGAFSRRLPKRFR